MLNGVNLNALAHRDPTLYGGMAYSELETRIYQWAKECHCSVRCLQTNDEGEFIDACHEARSWADGVIVNPGAWTHYSYAIRDALELFTVPVVEVHLSDITSREAWRRVSVIVRVADAAGHALAEFVQIHAAGADVVGDAAVGGRQVVAPRRHVGAHRVSVVAVVVEYPAVLLPHCPLLALGF